MRINIHISESGVTKNVIAHTNEHKIVEVKVNRSVTIVKDQTKITIEG